MTYLPSTDRLAEHLNPVCDEVACLNEDLATAVEVGATTIIGIVSESLRDLRDQSIESAKAMGLPEEVATEPFESVTDALFAIAQPRIDALREAVEEAKAPEVEDEGPEVPDFSDVDDAIEALFASLLGPEVAAQMRAEVEANDRAKAAEEYDAQYEGDEDALRDEAQEVEDFLNDLFNGGRR